jgi:hypothetical protein
MTLARDLTHKHRANGVLLDTNILLLYLVGHVNPQRIERFDRTHRYTISDFLRLNELVREFSIHWTTPTILSEVSNLAKVPGKELDRMRELIAAELEYLEEVFEPSSRLTRHPVFARFGLTDAGIASLAERPVLTITDDFDLYGWLTGHGADAINLNHLRAV